METTVDIVRLCQECPGAILSIKAGDLIEANNRLIAETRRELEQSIMKRNDVTFLTREMVIAKLNVVPSTLWRWAKSGYLVPINVGGQRRYRSTDIDEILEGKR